MRHYHSQYPALWLFAMVVMLRQIKVRALYDYVAQRDDELTFCKHTYITNVQKQDGGWYVCFLTAYLDLHLPTLYCKCRTPRLRFGPMIPSDRGVFRDLIPISLGYP